MKVKIPETFGVKRKKINTDFFCRKFIAKHFFSKSPKETFWAVLAFITTETSVKGIEKKIGLPMLYFI